MRKELNKNAKDNEVSEYNERLVKYNIDVISNIKMSFDVAIDYTKRLAKNIDDITNYKMFILCLNNALELLFKFMVFNRNEFLLYSHDNRDKVYKKYKKAKESGYRSLEMYFADNPLENNLHTISFIEARDILYYVYQIDNFDESLFERCEELSRVRNSLIHYSAIIRKIDIIYFSDMLRTSIEWYNREIEEKYIKDNFNILLGNKEPEDYFYKSNDYELWGDIFSIKNNTLKTEIFEDELCQQIMGFIIENRYSKLIEVDSRDYAEVEQLFFEQKPKNKKNNEMRKYFHEKYHIMLIAEMFVNKGMAAGSSPYSPIVMSRLDLADNIYRYLKEKWPDEGDQRNILNISKSLYQLDDEYYDSDYEDYI